MAYTTDKKSTGLDTLTQATLTQSDLHIVGDVSDSGRAKAITQNHLEDYIANSTNFIDELVANTYFTTEISGNIEVVTDGTTIIGDGTTGNPLVATAGAGAGIVKATSADTTPGYLDGKISITSTDGSVTVTKTINNPAGNEDIEYDLSASGSVSVLTVNTIDDFVQNVRTSADASTERGVSGNFIIENISGADPAYVELGSSETNHPGIVDLTVSSGAELYGFTNVDQGFTSVATRTIPTGNDFNFKGLFRSVRPGGSFDSIFGLSLDGIGFGIYVRFNSATSATKVLFYDGSVQTTTAINLPTSNTWTSFEIDWNVGTSTLVFKIGGVTVYSGTPTFTGSHIGFSAGNVSGTAGTKLSFDYITTTYTVTR